MEPGDFHPAGLDRVRAVADAVLYEGYLLYPYRATSRKNQLRWQFGVLGPQGADAAGIGEDSHLSMQCLLDLGANETVENAQATLTIHVRFLQLQQRRTERANDRGGYVLVPELLVDSERWFSWDEAVEVEFSRELPIADLRPATPGTWQPIQLRALSRSMISTAGWPAGSSGSAGRWRQRSSPSWSQWLDCIGLRCPSTTRRRPTG